MTKPEFTVKAGGIQVSVWPNKTDKGTFRSITINKSYKDSAGNWKQSKSFKVTDLDKIRVAIDEVLRYVYLKGDVIKPEVANEGNDDIPF